VAHFGHCFEEVGRESGMYSFEHIEFVNSDFYRSSSSKQMATFPHLPLAMRA
jgi:hypothetical protein